MVMTIHLNNFTTKSQVHSFQGVLLNKVEGLLASDPQESYYAASYSFKMEAYFDQDKHFKEVVLIPNIIDLALALDLEDIIDKIRVAFIKFNLLLFSQEEVLIMRQLAVEYFVFKFIDHAFKEAFMRVDQINDFDFMVTSSIMVEFIIIISSIDFVGQEQMQDSFNSQDLIILKATKFKNLNNI